MKFGIVVFPGTWSDGDCFHATKNVLGQEAEFVWHKQRDIDRFDAIVLPGGFSYGDYLRCGAIARFAPVMESVAEHAAKGKLAIGICNGFQILCEAGLLPGQLIMNDHLEFRCQWVNLRVENDQTQFTHLTRKGQVLRVPISHGEGNYTADPETIDELERERRVILRYCTPDGDITRDANPNGSLNNIAGIMNERGNVLGMMPHPERCVEALLGGTDGRLIFESMFTPVPATARR
ncbi:MAG: phosphoribosylformylglycinamidine synthase subunit PurQ [Chloroflexi bacterium]|nr:phosphoribosylformylglycinamidine synthase subunit PurQ [Chloroflexota bacterium]